jgi:FKBP-type peptidyl-prolyl cis-trans isomerase
MKFVSFIFLILLLTNCSDTKQESKEIVSNSGLRYTVLKKGTGEPARTGQEVVIYESMGLLSGKQFYALERPAPPINFTLGTKQVIDGVDEAVTGMKVGEIRRVIVPPQLSKRQDYPPYLSPDSTLLYKIELVEIKSNP